MNSTVATTMFDYSKLDKDTKGKLIALAGQLRKCRESYNNTVVATGRIISEAHELLAADGKEGMFTKWVESDGGFSRQTAYNYLWSYQRFANCKSLLQFKAEALYLLASPKCPIEAAKEAVKLADKGQMIDKEKAAALADKYKPESPPSSPRQAPTPSASAPSPVAMQSMPAPPKPATVQGECPKGGDHEFDDEACVKCLEPASKPAKVQPTPPPQPEPPPEESPVSKLFAKLLEDIRQAIKTADDIHNAVGRKGGQLHESIINSLDIAGQDAKKWRGLVK